MSSGHDDTQTRLRVSSESHHQKRRRIAGAGLLLLAAFIVWGVSALGSGSSGGGSPADSFSARLAKVGGIGSESLYAASKQQEGGAIDSVLQSTPYIVKAGGAKKAVALTFDDGPSEWTPQILSVLRKNGVAGTFFNIGGNISTYGPNTNQALQAGNAVGDHTWSHPQMTTFSPADQSSEIKRTAEALTAIGVPEPRLYRPPYGAYDQNTLAITKKNKQLLVLWDVDSLDWSKPGVDAIVNNITSAVTNGSIILMHDGGGERSQTLAALPRVIAFLRKNGYSMVTVPRLLAEDPPRAGETPPPAGQGA